MSLRAGIGLFETPLSDPVDDIVGCRPVRVVRDQEGSEGGFECLTLPVAPDLSRQGLGHVSAATAWAGNLVDRFDQLRGQDQVRAHIHAHTIAHGRAPSRRPDLPHTARAARRSIDPVEDTRRDWDADRRRPRRDRIGGCLLAEPVARRRRPRPRALRDGPSSTAPPPTTAGSSGCPTTGPTTCGSPSAPTRRGPRSSARPGERIVTIDRRTRPVAGRPGHPDGRLHRQPRRRGRPVRAASMRPRSASAGRSGTSTTTSTGMWQAHGGLADPFRGNAAHRRLAAGPRRDAARPHAGDRDPRRGRRRPRGRDAGRDLPDRAGRARRRRLDQRPPRLVRPAAAADRDQGAGHLLRLPGPGRLRARPLPGLDLDGRAVASTASRPTARPARRRPRTAAARRSIRTGGRSSATRRPSLGSRPSSPSTCRGARPADLHQDVPVHADPGSGLRGRSTARPARASWSRSGRPTASSSPRSSAGSWPSSASTARPPRPPSSTPFRDRSADPARRPARRPPG